MTDKGDQKDPIARLGLRDWHPDMGWVVTIRLKGWQRPAAVISLFAHEMQAIGEALCCAAEAVQPFEHNRHCDQLTFDF